MAIKKFAATLEKYLYKKPKSAILLSALALDLFIGYLDYLAGYEVHLNIFYLIPILLTAWFAGKRAGVIMTIICISTIAIAYLFGGEFNFHHWHLIRWNIFLIEGFFLIITFLSVQIKGDIVERKKIIQDLRYALANVKTLSGLLPMCTSCKKIRDDKGYWTQVETYKKSEL